VNRTGAPVLTVEQMAAYREYTKKARECVRIGVRRRGR
jgi:hypothetical protein